MIATKLDTFTRAYIEAALWSSIDDDEKQLDDRFSLKDIAPTALEKIVADCAKFQADNAAMIVEGACDRGNGAYSVQELAGHDFWLTRNGYGAGFWDGEWPKHGDALTKAARAFGECDLYVGDDGKLYI